MSLGFCGKCTLSLSDESTAVYSYTGQNWNLDRELSTQLERDEGSFTIEVVDGELAIMEIVKCGVDAHYEEACDTLAPDVWRKLFCRVNKQYELDGKFPEEAWFIQ